MDLILERYNAPDHTAIYSRTGSTAISPHGDRAGSPLAFGYGDGRVVGELLKLDIDQQHNRIQAICRVDEPVTRNMVLDGTLSALCLPVRYDETPYLTDIPQPITATFKYYAGPREVALQKRFVPSGLNKRRQEALTEVYRQRTSSPENLQNWQSGRLLRSLGQPARKAQGPNRNAAIIFGSSLAADAAISRTDELLRASSKAAVDERRQNRNAIVIDRSNP
jgi:hypothetical protein